MNLDVISSIELTATAAIVVASAALLLGRTPRIRVSITVALGLWFVWAVSLAASPFFAPSNPLGLPGLGLSVFLPLIAIVVAANRIPQIKEALRNVPLASLVALNILRVAGVTFVLLKAQERIAPTFASSAGWGDISVGLLAIPLSWLLATRKTNSNALLWIWNSLGLLDLITAIGLGVTSSPGPLRLIVEAHSSALMTTLPWFLIPGFLVPLFASSHLAIFWRLTGSRVPARRSERFDAGLAEGTS